TLGPSGAFPGAGSTAAGMPAALASPAAGDADAFGSTAGALASAAMATGRASGAGGARRTNQISVATSAAPTTAQGQVRRAGAVSIGWNSGRSVDMGLSSVQGLWAMGLTACTARRKASLMVSAVFGA